MIRTLLLLLLLLLLGCSKSPTFQKGRFRSIQQSQVDIETQLNRERLTTLPLLLDSGVVLTPVENNDTLASILSFRIEKWQGVSDQEYIISVLASASNLKENEIGDITIFMPREKAEFVLEQL